MGVYKKWLLNTRQLCSRIKIASPKAGMCDIDAGYEPSLKDKQCGLLKSKCYNFIGIPYEKQ
jgi:hypothetical protein